MSAHTSIEWTDQTWNPVRGCSRVSEGCRNCYAERVAARFSGPGQPYEGLAYIDDSGESRMRHRWTREVRMVPEKLDQPLRWKRPRRVFVNSMSDLFHERLAFKDVSAVLRIAWTTHQQVRAGERATDHVYQVLTKRPRRMLEYFRWLADQRPGSGSYLLGLSWPLPNVWLGVSIEDQQTADERIPLLLQTPAAVRFVSAEPLLGPIDFRKATGILALDDCQRCTDWRGNHIPTCQEPFCDCKSFVPGISWVIVGGESGPGARPTDVAWIRSIVEQCRDAGTACFVKQLGARPAYGLDVAPLPAPQSAESIMRHGEYDPEPDWLSLRDRKGGDPAEWPADLRVREFPCTEHERARASA